METKPCQFCGETKSLKEFNLKDRNTGRRNSICKVCEAAQAKERYHIKHPLAPTRAFQKDDFHCDTCGELKDPGEFHYARGNRQGICRKCYDAKMVEYRHAKNPSAKYIKFKKDDFHCTRCGELKTPKDFYYVNGRREGVCKKCHNARSIELAHLKNPSKKYKSNEKFYCYRCGRTKSPEDFNYYRSGPTEAGAIKKLCKDCTKIQNKKYHDLYSQSRQIAMLKWEKAFLTRDDTKKQADAVIKALEVGERVQTNPLPKAVKRDFDYAVFRHLIGRYKICPQCGIERSLADFTEIKQSLLWSGSFKYVINYREVYSECSGCRVRMHELFDQFVMNAF
jgi:recombinational DNA repair protein (RecF pathway)